MTFLVCAVILGALILAADAWGRRDARAIQAASAEPRWSVTAPESQPVVFAFLGNAEQTSDPYYGRIASALRAKGWLVVSCDLPCHGRDARQGEAPELEGWRERFEKGEDFVGRFCFQAGNELGKLGPRRVAVYGISRGGFLALHWAARDPRVTRIAALAPVTDPAELREFHGLGRELSVERLNGSGLSKTARVWMPEKDERVSEVACARACAVLGVPLVTMKVREHTVTPEAMDEAAEWLAEERR